MSEKGKKWLSGKGFDKWFQRDNLIVLVLSGILLFIIALPTKESNQSGETSKSGTTVADFGIGGISADDTDANNMSTYTGSGADLSATGQVAYGTEQDYATYLEGRLEKVLGGVSGVGKVSVMVTLASTEELVVEKDEPVSRSNVNETDSEGGSRITSQYETNETTIYSTESGVSEPYVVMRILPKVEGVLVVAEGAGSGTVSKSVSEIIQALFDLEAHKIKVVKMEGSN